MALYGQELDEETTPLEAGLEWVVKFDKGDFIGRDALRRQQSEGVSRRLVGIELTGRGIARRGHPVRRNGSPVGAVTSGTWSPTLERAVAMAYVSSAAAAGDGELEVEVRERPVAARLVQLPFYRRTR
jgi:aminomethyltransferase